ncbi:MAG: hypothetical protein U0175_17425 [Caldilineaceae bacterium]
MSQSTNPASYRLRARLLCHDVRMNRWIESIVALAAEPNVAEAIRLLQPLADQTVAADNCEDCPYELLDVTISPA